MGHRVWLIEATVGFERNNSAMKRCVKATSKVKIFFLKKKYFEDNFRQKFLILGFELKETL